MFSLYLILQAIIIIVWIVDILNIDFIINGIHIAELLDTIIPLNGWFWFLIWLFLPSGTITYKDKEEK